MSGIISGFTVEDNKQIYIQKNIQTANTQIKLSKGQKNLSYTGRYFKFFGVFFLRKV